MGKRVEVRLGTLNRHCIIWPGSLRLRDRYLGGWMRKRGEDDGIHEGVCAVTQHGR